MAEEGELDLDFLEQVAEDAVAFEVKDEDIKSIAEAAKLQIRLENLAEMLEEATKSVNKALEQVRDRLLPDLMIDVGSKSFELDNGAKVSLSSIYFPAVNKDDQPKFFDWMVKEGHGHVVSAAVVVDLGKGGYEDAKQLAVKIQELTNQEVEVQGSIHWATHRAFAKEQSEKFEKLSAEEKGDRSSPFPPEMKVHRVDRAKITRPKGAKHAKK
jgi:hypothetical protein